MTVLALYPSCAWRFAFVVFGNNLRIGIRGCLKKTTFEVVRVKWLKMLNGPYMVQYVNDLEKEQDARVAASMIPEYLAIWKRAAEEAEDEGS